MDKEKMFEEFEERINKRMLKIMSENEETRMLILATMMSSVSAMLKDNKIKNDKDITRFVVELLGYWEEFKDINMDEMEKMLGKGKK